MVVSLIPLFVFPSPLAATGSRIERGDPCYYYIEIVLTFSKQILPHFQLDATSMSGYTKYDVDLKKKIVLGHYPAGELPKE